MELEVRVLDERDFKELRQYATYASEATKVMAFDSSVMRKGIPLLDKYFTVSETSRIKEEETRYIIDMDENRKITLIAPDSYSAFSFAVKPKGSDAAFIPVSSLREIYIMKKYGLVNFADGFSRWFSPVDKDCKLSELHSFTNKTKFRTSKSWTFKQYFDDQFENGTLRIPANDLTVSNTKIFAIDEAKSIPIMNEIRGKVLDVNYKAKKAQIETPNGIIEITMHGWTPFKYGCWMKDKEIRLLYKKMYGDEKKQEDGSSSYKKIIDPIVLPEDIKIDNKEKFYKDMLMLSNRRYPSDLLNRMYFEYKIRTLE
jgi:hypothetical protein